MNTKRVIICTIGGIIAAGICIGGMASGGMVELTPQLLIPSIGNRILIGFVIEISGWRLHYLLHGSLIGLIVTLSGSIVIALSSMTGFIMYTAAGALYGLLIDLAATKLLKAPMA